MTVSARGRHRPFAKEDDLMFAQYRGAAAAGAALLVPLLAWTPPTERVKVSGRHTMTVKPKTKPGVAVMDLRQIVLKPTK